MCYVLPKNRSSFGHAKDRHPHHLDAAIGKLRQLGEPFLNIGHGVVRLEIRLAGENLVKDEMAWLGAVLLKKIDQILGVAAKIG